MRISDWSSDVCSSDLERAGEDRRILVERDPGEPAADDRLADFLGEIAGTRGAGVRHDHPGLEAGDSDGVADRRIDEFAARRRAAIVERADVGIGGGGTARSEEHTSELQTIMRR